MPTIDFLIATPLDEEWTALTSVIGEGRETPDDDGRTWYTWAFPSPKKPRYLCAGASMGRMGQSESATFAVHGLRRWEPAAVVLVGIAGSLRDKKSHTLGDVIVADELVGYEVSSAEKGGSVPRMTGSRPSFVLLDRVRALKASRAEYSEWQKACWSTPEARSLKKAGILSAPPRLHFGVVASGNEVVKSRLHGERLKKQLHPKLAAVEMEGTGVCNALWQSPSTDILMLRGLSDFADEKKSALDKRHGGTVRAYAAANAARLFQNLLHSDRLPPIWEPYSLDSTMRLDLREVERAGVRVNSEPSQHLYFPALLERHGPTPALTVTIDVFPRTVRTNGVVLQQRIGSLIRGLPGNSVGGRWTFAVEAVEAAHRLQALLGLHGECQRIDIRVEDSFGAAASARWQGGGPS